jgi:hypothetical protein
MTVFENRFLREIFGSKRDEIPEEWIKPHNEELYVMYCSPSIIRVIKSRTMRWAGHLALWGREELHTRFW